MCEAVTTWYEVRIFHHIADYLISLTSPPVSQEADVEDLVVAKDLAAALADVDFVWCV